ncbi:LacI family DNA-binding transcriptional regulator [Demequina phytophila]|uniref:LacI family DNA-binding transcriptional regulator n=1 Tax=Demequina phytophila TaxID=1638981 RepID=UPI000782224C|nr:LacI family DNA-binding transcriptional regulator [Demequina phytophila]
MRAGVSRATVSQILNGRAHLFAPSTVDKVTAAAEELDYRPSVAARALVTGHSDIAVLVVPYVTFGPHLQAIIDDLADRLSTIGLLLVVEFVRHDVTPLLRLVDQLRPALVIDLAALSPRQRDALRHSGAVVPGGEYARDEVGALQVRHLVERGAVRVDYALLADSRDDAYGPARVRAAQDECARLGLPAPRVLRIRADVEAAEDALRSLAVDSGPTAIACYNDDIGSVLVTAAGRLGLRVPGDLSVIGMDDSLTSRVCVPALTTITMDLAGAVDVTFELVRAALDNKPHGTGEVEAIDFAPLLTLIQRAST